MTQQQILLGSLSQDLFRIANFIQTGSVRSALRFWQEANRWLAHLQKESNLAGNPAYLTKILKDIANTDFDPTSLEQGEKLLTYGVILQSIAVNGVSKQAP